MNFKKNRIGINKKGVIVKICRVKTVLWNAAIKTFIKKIKKNKIASLVNFLKNNINPKTESIKIGEVINKPGILFCPPNSQLSQTSLFKKLVNKKSKPGKKSPDNDVRKDCSSGNSGLYLFDFSVISPKSI